ncbi:MAG: serine hydrolase [Aggregatilineales bacterium]
MTAGLSGLGTRKRSRSGIPFLPIISIMMLLGAAGLFVLELVTFSQQADRLPSDVTVAGVPVDGLSPGEAVTRWENALTQPVVLWYNESPILIDPAVLGFRINSAAMLAQVRATADIAGSNWQRFFYYLTGQEAQNPINIPLVADYQQNLLEQFLRDIALRYDRPPGKATYDIQTLTIRPGSGGYALNQRAALAAVDAALRSPDSRSVRLPVESTGQGSTDLSVLRDMIVEYLDTQGFLYDGQNTVASVYIQDLQTGEEINILSDVAFSAASTIKVAILIDYFRYLSLAPTDEEAYLMANSLLCSNNSSSNLIMQIIGGGTNIFNGLASVTNTAQYLGARNTFITAPFILGVEGQQLGSITRPQTSPNPNYNTDADPFNQTTAEDLGTLFGMIYDCANYGSGLMAAFPNGEFTQNECRQMLELMSANDLMRLLQGGIPPGTRISHKNGWLSTMHGDAGIVFSPNGRHYVISVFLWENTDFFSFERAWPLIEGISRAAWNYFNPENPLLAPRSDLPPTAMECSPQDGTTGFLPPFGQVNLNDINAWRRAP